MALAEKISAEMKKAMKSREKLWLETLRSIRAALHQREIEKRGKGPITEEDEVVVLHSLVKKRRESIELFEKGGRTDLVEQEKKELEIIQTFLPPQLGVDEIEKTVSSVITEVGAMTEKDVGKVMSAAMKRLKGKADGKVVQDVARRLLQVKA